MKIILIAAVTADGFIGRTSGHTADWTSKEDKQLFVDVTKQAGVIVMGSKTFETLNRALPGRHTIILTSRPEDYATPEVEFTTEQPEELCSRLNAQGHKTLAVCGGAQIYQAFLNAGLVDELYITVEPFLFGKGVSLATDTLDLKLNLIETKKLNQNSVLLKYRVLR